MTPPTAIPQILKDCRSAMEKAVESSKREFGTIRSGKASPNMLDTVRVEVYGQAMQLNQVASVSAPEPRVLIVTPYDKGQVKAIEKAIRESDLGLEPSAQGGIIRVPLPQMNEQRRKDLVKVLHKLAEEGHIAVRHARTDARDKVKKLDRVGEDDKKHAEKDLQKLHDDFIAKIDQLVKAKEAEIMEVCELGVAATMSASKLPTAELLATIRARGASPRHVAIIMDGNGRWARERLMPRAFGHRSGMQAVREVVEGAAEAGVEVLSLFAFSQENWARPRPEVSALMSLLEEYIGREVAELEARGVRVRVLGALDRLAPGAAAAVDRVVRQTAHNTRLTLNLFISYGGRAEIAEAARRVARDVAEGRLTLDAIDEDAVAARLYTADCPDPDLLIRTSGEHRISNFLLWQVAYAELYMSPVLWPDFTRRDLYEVIADFQCRERRYGRVSA